MSDRATQEAIQKLAGTFGKDYVYLIDCTVQSVDISTRTCDCLPIGGDAATELEGVQLMTETADGILLIPAIDSIVRVAISIKSPPMVVMFSELDNVTISANNVIQLQGDDYGGLVIAPVLLIALNALQTFAGQPLTTITSLTNPNVKHGI